MSGGAKSEALLSDHRTGGRSDNLRREQAIWPGSFKLLEQPCTDPLALGVVLVETLAVGPG